MHIFKDHKLAASQLLSVIPEALLSHLSLKTKVDYYAKMLHGKKLFYLLLYGIIENDRLSLRSLEDTFNDPIFKTLFNLAPTDSIRRSSISERLSKIDVDYFRQIYEFIYDSFSQIYTSSQSEKYNIIRVDSSMVSESSSKLLEGIDNKSGKKAAKHTVAFDGILPCNVISTTSTADCSEDTSLPKVIRSHVKQQQGHNNIYVVDRGLQSRRTMESFNNEDVKFVARAKEGRKFVELESYINDETDMNLGTLQLIMDSRVYLHTGVAVNNKRGNIHYRSTLVEEPFRLIVAKDVEEDKEYWFITNEFAISAAEVAHIYRRRWDIELFFYDKYIVMRSSGADDMIIHRLFDTYLIHFS